ncbi:MAG TPA: hypothetical protein DDZ89_19170 [Clostridiales bacterium]|nr:hypothetical protein [Clostridiales bacterium]
MWKISFIMQKKSEKIIELKRIKDNMLRKLYLAFIAFAIPFLWIMNFYHHFLPSFENTDHLFPDMTLPDYIALIATALMAVLVYSYTQLYKKAKTKYDSLRHDIMDNIGAVICNCHEQCNCREEYIKDMDEKGIDLIIR